MLTAESIINRIKNLNESAEDGKNIFLSPNIVMLDLEMNGVVPERDEILQIAMVKLVLKFQDGIPQYEALGDPLNIFVHTDSQPSNGFHQKYLVDIFAQANVSQINPEAANKIVNDWLGDWRGKAIPAGDAVNNDLGFLYNKGVIDRGDIVDDKPVPGSFHYEIYDINFPKDICRTIVGEREVLDLEDGIHNALVDCRNQTKELNHYLKVLFGPRP